MEHILLRRFFPQNNASQSPLASGYRVPVPPGTRHAIGDFNGDGATDIAFFHHQQAETTIYFSLGQPDGRWLTVGPITGAFASSEASVGEITGDGNQDLIFLVNESDRIAVQSVVYDENHGIRLLNSIITDWPASLIGDPTIVADFNGDTLTDILFLVAEAGDPTFLATQTLLANGQGGWNLGKKYQIDEWPSEIRFEPMITGRFNNDPQHDVLFVLGNSYTYDKNDRLRTRQLLGAPTGGWLTWHD